jgi:4-amino-4-deoxy-L-arabinose transferase-like glycosyltransferase
MLESDSVTLQHGRDANSTRSVANILAVLVILAIALALRCWGAFADLPYIFHPDEPVNLQIIQGMLITGDLDPHAFLYPSFQYYVNVGAAILFVVIPHWIAGNPVEFLPPLSIAMGSTFAPDPGSVELYRTVSICGGVLSVFLVYRIAKQAAGRRIGLLAAALAAVSPLLVDDCRHVTPDSYVVLFQLMTILASFAIAMNGKWSAYVAAGVAIGFTAASKYNGAIGCLFPIAAHFARVGLSSAAILRLVLAGGVSAVTFVVVCPYILIDHVQFATDLVYQKQTYSSSHAGMEGDSASWYLGEIVRATGIAALFAAFQMVSGFRRRDVRTGILACFALLYFAFIISFQIRNDRTLLPIIPCVLILAAMFVAYLRSADSVLSRVSSGLRTSLIAACVVAMIATPLYSTVARAVQLQRVDSRTTAREWIDANLPRGSVLLVESYSPYADPDRFAIVRSERAIDHPLSWFSEQGIEYVVLSQVMYARYFRAPFDHPSDTARYVALMKQFQLVKGFTDGGLEILVYRVIPAESNAAPQ